MPWESVNAMDHASLQKTDNVRLSSWEPTGYGSLTWWRLMGYPKSLVNETSPSKQKTTMTKTSWVSRYLSDQIDFPRHLFLMSEAIGLILSLNIQEIMLNSVNSDNYDTWESWCADIISPAKVEDCIFGLTAHRSTVEHGTKGHDNHQRNGRENHHLRDSDASHVPSLWVTNTYPQCACSAAHSAVPPMIPSAVKEKLSKNFSMIRNLY